MLSCWARARLSDGYCRILVPLTWIEHVASPLPRECSTTELQGLIFTTVLHGAGEGNRTLVLSLEGFSSTIELHPRGPMSSTYFTQLPANFGGGDWIRTSVLIRGQIYSLLPLTTRPPLREGTAEYEATSYHCQDRYLLISQSPADRVLRGEIVMASPANLQVLFLGCTFCFRIGQLLPCTGVLFPCSIPPPAGRARWPPTSCC